MRFERELTCERLRQQVVRLRESVGGAEPSASVERSQPPSGAMPAASANAGVETQTREHEAGIRAQPVAGPSPVVAAPEACKRDEERLARLRASRSRDEVSGSSANSAAKNCDRRCCACGKAWSKSIAACVVCAAKIRGARVGENLAKNEFS